jgi:YHS domain-containing protein
MELAAQGMYGRLAKDPVSGAEVSVSKAERLGRKSSHGGNVYYFSSDEFKQQFDKNPGGYIKK